MSGLRSSSETGMHTNGTSIPHQLQTAEQMEVEKLERKEQIGIYRQYYERLERIQLTPCEELQVVEERSEKVTLLSRAIWRLNVSEMNLAEDLFINHFTVRQLMKKYNLTEQEINQKADDLVGRLQFFVKSISENELKSAWSRNGQFGH